ncbi:MAG: glycosyltransferase [Solirubrobacterales bacterium]|nr:glycosyltransferase [Solirubrobacterales bacterium]
MSGLRCLGVLLCYNDGDLLEESISYLLEQHHDLIAWDHGSTDETPSILERFRPHCREIRRVPREFDFYQLYQAMSRHLIESYVTDYDWVSWPDQDEFLEGPARDRSYYEYVVEAHDAGIDWIRFRNFNYWCTDEDDPTVSETTRRVRHYALRPDCPPRIRSWRAKVTNVRRFNHNALDGRPSPRLFDLRHYPMRSPSQMRARVLHDRAGLRRGNLNFHYANMRHRLESLQIPADALHYDDGVSDLDPDPIFDWRSIYGRAPADSDLRSGQSRGS